MNCGTAKSGNRGIACLQPGIFNSAILQFGNSAIALAFLDAHKTSRASTISHQSVGINMYEPLDNKNSYHLKCA